MDSNRFDLSFNPFDESLSLYERLRKVEERSRLPNVGFGQHVDQNDQIDINFNPFDESIPLHERLQKLEERSRLPTIGFGQHNKFVDTSAVLLPEYWTPKEPLGVSECLRRRREY